MSYEWLSYFDGFFNLLLLIFGFGFSEESNVGDCYFNCYDYYGVCEILFAKLLSYFCTSSEKAEAKVCVPPPRLLRNLEDGLGDIGEESGVVN